MSQDQLSHVDGTIVSIIQSKFALASASSKWERNTDIIRTVNYVLEAFLKKAVSVLHLDYIVQTVS
jgi:hypothetical protein